MSALTGPINNCRKKSDLEAIALVLEIDSTGTMKVLIPHIITHLDKHPELAENIKFQGLFSYRPDSTPAEKKMKRSSDKVAEDEIEANVAVGKPTGANKTLLDLKVTTDPPPQFGRLGTTGTAVRGGPVTPDRDMGDDSSPAGLPDLGNGSDSDHIAVPSEKEMGVTVATSLSEALKHLKGTDISSGVKPNTTVPFVVNFFDHTDPTKPAEEIWLEDGFTATSSKGQMTASLSLLLPNVIQNASPIKEHGGRLYRPGQAADSSHIAIATPAVPVTQAEPLAVKAKPLEVARDMKETKARIKNNVIASPPVDDEFIAYLHEYFNLEDISWPWAESVTSILDWYLKVEAVFQSLKEKGWAKGSRGGFCVPADHPRYATQAFVRNDMYNALQLPSSKAHGDAKLFSPESLLSAPKAAAWVLDPKGEYQEFFSRMTPAKFKRYLEDCKEDAKHDSTKKRKKQIAHPDDSGEEAGGHKLKKGKGKAKPQVDSDSLDGSDDILHPQFQSNNTSRMAASVKDLTLILELFFPAALSLLSTLYILATIISVYPLLLLHKSQQREPRQPRNTAWFKSLVAIIALGFQAATHPELALFVNNDLDIPPEQQLARNIGQDLEAIYEFLGIDDNFHSDPIHELFPQSVRLLDRDLVWIEADLFVAHCPVCCSDYYPDKITFACEGKHLQKLEYDTNYLRVSKHRIWMHRKVALAQEKVLHWFHAGWSNFAGWLNDTIKEKPAITN
ncbi:uncharacterized protein LACBIDRAFT_314252 [Laccaria bicolor S238N-H82]|uniref:Predicted protein n=1 Tax=Laccaria bicolor (strain S238N-H82 / ATCC MYA-4686) TaxID=486041 RepID=B0D1X4_LACBS|nr:uncharacterized protein LACBIDRAFT_314252 [Laccaria bicolor S238N-H82]EDR11717.1 predicted protein [Laccaria bicolor S238N-H82]|eukprot:XP_001877614.1 predicted protein [Laccaria bicolor S238N-H82]